MTETTAPEGAATPKRVPTGAKLLIGCLGLFALGLVALALAVGVGGFALKRGVESALGGLDEHQRASEALRRLETAHPFDVPQDGVVTNDQAKRYLLATDLAWEDLESWAESSAALSERSRERGRPSLRDLIGGGRSLAGAARARLVLAEALERADMSLGEYVWTGLTLDRAARSAARPGGSSGIPPANLELVERYGPSIPNLDSNSTPGDADEPARGSVLAVAVLWGVAEVPTWQALGLDTLQDRLTR